MEKVIINTEGQGEKIEKIEKIELNTIKIRVEAEVDFLEGIKISLLKTLLEIEEEDALKNDIMTLMERYQRIRGW